MIITKYNAQEIMHCSCVFVKDPTIFAASERHRDDTRDERDGAIDTDAGNDPSEGGAFVFRSRRTWTKDGGLVATRLLPNVVLRDGERNALALRLLGGGFSHNQMEKRGDGMKHEKHFNTRDHDNYENLGQQGGVGREKKVKILKDLGKLWEPQMKQATVL